VHALPSLHAVPFAAAGLEHAPVDGLHVPAVWHESLAAQVTGFEPVQTPAWHVSLCVHALPSLQVVPFVAAGLEQAPVVALHVPATWQASLAAQVTGFEPVQTPAWQVSVCVHALPSLQVVPFAAVGFEHVPVDGLHVPAVWHASPAAHVTGFEPVQTPAWQVSVCVHALPSLQLPPLVGAHVPADPGTLHAWHWPQEVAVVLQQTPSTHVPEAHCPVDGQGPPNPGVATVTVNVICDVLFALSVAVHVTGVVPTANVLPEGGVHVTGVQGFDVAVHAGPDAGEAEVEQST
jgi:hypothetical protein